MLPSTDFDASSFGSCCKKPTRIPLAGNASPMNSASSPAMMRSRLLFPAPLAPSTPILAPKKKESQIPFRISRFGGTTRRRSFMVKMNSGI